jgi:hypothetical protein
LVRPSHSFSLLRQHTALIGSLGLYPDASLLTGRHSEPTSMLAHARAKASSQRRLTVESPTENLKLCPLLCPLKYGGDLLSSISLRQSRFRAACFYLFASGLAGESERVCPFACLLHRRRIRP